MECLLFCYGDFWKVCLLLFSEHFLISSDHSAQLQSENSSSLKAEERRKIKLSGEKKVEKSVLSRHEIQAAESLLEIKICVSSIQSSYSHYFLLPT